MAQWPSIRSVGREHRARVASPAHVPASLGESLSVSIILKFRRCDDGPLRAEGDNAPFAEWDSCWMGRGRRTWVGEASVQMDPRRLITFCSAMTADDGTDT
ncbi:hypothetical protein Hypma_003880 [Hypsizygus marmoreus]|uniref:Uncharacterized protein n=1 Tax=Hypsizygus marmoreus TaxID=39966 RepID=A0A369JYZ3_HYPMA|nr:hypothetical protein Hypma_003880 [Hypsizygus marmoreus]